MDQAGPRVRRLLLRVYRALDRAIVVVPGLHRRREALDGLTLLARVMRLGATRWPATVSSLGFTVGARRWTVLPYWPAS
jgi:hypothetical protein